MLEHVFFLTLIFLYKERSFNSVLIWDFQLFFLKLSRRKPAVSLANFIIYKVVYIIIHFVIIIVSYQALIRLPFVELGFRQIKRKCYTTIAILTYGSEKTRILAYFMQCQVLNYSAVNVEDVQLSDMRSKQNPLEAFSVQT